MLVVGSVNVDIVVTTDRRARPGETVIGTGLRRLSGGKGGNQAVAAARAGARTAMVCAVGADPDGARLLDELTAAGVDVDAAQQAPEPTGTAVIVVTPDGENSITVVPGANHLLDVAPARLPPVAATTVVLVQLEIAAHAVDTVVRLARSAGARTVVNLSPLPPSHADARRLLAVADPVVVNALEAREILGPAAGPGTSLATLATALVDAGARSAVVTGGADGAAWAVGESAATVPAVPVAPVDTTGAGDAFAGTLAARLSLGDGLADAVGSAVEAGAEATRWLGARPLPMSPGAAMK